MTFVIISDKPRCMNTGI